MSNRRQLRSVTRAAVYCRISLSRFGDTIKVDDQEKVCRELATGRGWSVADDHVYKDNSKSAWRRDRKRPDWDRMLDAVASGEVDAIVVYHGDRLIRQPWDLELLLRLADERGIKLASPVGERNLDNADDRFILRIEAAQACRESDNTSRRSRRGYDRLAEQGRTRAGGAGGRPFGYEPDQMTVRESEAEMIREVARRVLAHEPIGAICRDLNTRGYRTTPGNPWEHGSLKKLMLRPRLTGLLEHHGTIVGPGAWPEILDRETWEAVRAVLTRKADAFGYTTNARKYLLTGIAVCGTPGCGQPLAIRHNTRGKTLLGYGCISKACPKKVHRAIHHLDAYVEGAVLRRLHDPELRQRAAKPANRDLVAKLAGLEARREAVIDAFADDDDDLVADVEAQRRQARDMRAAVGRVDERIRQLRDEIAIEQAGHELDDLWGISLQEWQDLLLSRQRAAVRALLRVTVLPAGRRGPGFDPSTVQLVDALRLPE